MVLIKASYEGNKHCLALHTPSGSELETDASKDNQGLGEKFSPSDLMATALGTCILTTLAIACERDGIDLKGTQITIEKVMSDNPRRISSLKTTLRLSKNIVEDYKRKIKQVAEACPVKKSIHPDILTPVEIIYDL